MCGEVGMSHIILSKVQKVALFIETIVCDLEISDRLELFLVDVTSQNPKKIKVAS